MGDHESICPECREAIASLRKIVSALPGLVSRAAEPSDRAKRAAADILGKIDAEDGDGLHR